MAVYLQKTDAHRRHPVRDQVLCPRDQHSLKQCRHPLFSHITGCPYQLQQKFPAVFHMQRKLSVCPYRQNDMIDRILYRHWLCCPPQYIQDIRFVNKIYFTMKWCLPVCRNADNPAQQRNIFCRQCMTSRFKQIQCLSVLKKDRLLRFMHDQLGTCVEILRRMFPDKHIRRSFVLYNFRDIQPECHSFSPLCIFYMFRDDTLSASS